jgi:Domain of unknown function (DUF4386)
MSQSVVDPIHHGDITERPRRVARIAGCLYLILAVLSYCSFFAARAVYKRGDAATSAANVVAHSGLVRFGVIADLLAETIFLLLAMTFFRLLQHVNRHAAGALMTFVAVAVAITCVAAVFEFVALLVAKDGSTSTASGFGRSDAAVLQLLDLHHFSIAAAGIFFGLWLVPLGYLAYRSAMFPKALGVLLIVGAACYIANTLASFLISNYSPTTSSLILMPSTLAEIWMIGHLLAKGVRVSDLALSPQESASETGRAWPDGDGFNRVDTRTKVHHDSNR